MKKISFLFIVLQAVIATIMLFLLINVTIHTVIFKDKACISPINQSNYKLCDNFVVHIDGDKFVVPKNFKTKVGAMSRLVWVLYANNYDVLVNPLVLHDYLYQCPGNYARNYADDVFYSALIQNDVSGIVAGVIWVGVKLLEKDSFKQGRRCDG